MFISLLFTVRFIWGVGSHRRDRRVDLDALNCIDLMMTIFRPLSDSFLACTLVLEIRTRNQSCANRELGWVSQ